MKCGLLGARLSHSFSPDIHKFFGDYEYRLYEKKEEELSAFFSSREFDGLNVTAPYKKAVIPFLDELSPLALRIGGVNTVVNKDGRLIGYNTDCYGFCALLENAGIDVKGKKALVLGSGGAAAAVRAAIEDKGGTAVIISRTGENNYENIYNQTDAGIIVNATPVGMYPDNGRSPVDLSGFSGIEWVADIIYNPARTALLLQAQKLGIKTANGLYMLVAQAKRSSELFTGIKINDKKIPEIAGILSKKTRNIILIGMPGSGKTEIAKEIGRLTSRPVADSDGYIEKKLGVCVPDFLARNGEAAFRKAESEALAELGRQSGTVISTGGGCVTVPGNYDLLRQNGVIVWIKREISLLSKKNRPLSQGGTEEMYKERKPLYERFADITVTNGTTPAAAAEEIIKELL